MADYEPLVIERAQGCWLTTTDGQQLFDGVSSLWCNVHGHRHPKIDAAITSQLDRVAHVTSLGMSSDITETLAAKLAEITPGDLQHVFFSSDGSSAVEAALKMALQYWRGRENPQPEKTKYVALGLAYHGDTTGAVALGGIDYFHSLFAPLLFSPLRGPTPCSYRLPAGVSPESAADHYVGELEAILRQHHATIAAVVMEPLVQGAAGMLTHPPGFLGQVRRLCDKYDVLLICDEVAVGFGRTGSMFACQQESVVPDILCLGKGLNGGYLPMAATIARSHVYQAFLGPAIAMKQFFHGHTFGGNPLAAAAALASLELFDENDLLKEISRKAQRLRDRLSPLADHPQVGDIRGRGLLVGIELVADRASKTPLDRQRQTGRQVCRRAIQDGAWIRPLGDVILLVPPLVASDDELDMLADITVGAIRSELAQVDNHASTEQGVLA